MGGTDDLTRETVALGSPRSTVTQAARRTKRRPPLSPGVRVERYEILELIGRGGMGAVYAAHDPDLDRKVAVKMLFVGENGDSGEADRLVDEGRALARLTHPNVVTVFDVGRHEGSVFLAMELVDGPTLGDWLASQPQDWRRRLEVFIDVGRGLAAVHACGLLHLDFKPGNVIVDAEQRVRLADFGLAAGDLDTDPSEQLDPEFDGDPASVDFSRARGTPRYMAPEQQQAGTVTAAADQFAFCVALYEALAGRHPFGTAESVEERLRRTALTKAVSMQVEELPLRVTQAIMRGLDHDPAKRWPSIAALLDELELATRKSSSIRWMALGVLGVGGAALALTMVNERSSAPGCPAPSAKATEVLSATQARELDAAVSAFEAAHGKLPVALVASLQQRVDDWSNAWSTACEAAHIASEQQEPDAHRVLDCLGAQQAALEGTAELLLEAETSTLVRATGLLHGLESPSVCTDRQTVSVPPPAPEQRGAVAEVRAQIQRALLQHEAGRVEDAIETAEAAVAKAEAVEYTPLLTEALATAGKLNADNKIVARAEPMLERAAWLALESGDQQTATRLFVTLVDAGRPGDRLDDTLAWADRARASLAEHPDARLESQLESSLAFAYWKIGRREESIAHARRGIALLAPGVGDELDLATAKHGLAVALMGAGGLLEAERNILEAIEVRSEHLGANHTSTASSQRLLASILNSQGRNTEALELHDKVVAATVLAHGAGSRITAGAYSNRGVALSHDGQYEEAIADFDRAAEAWDRLGNYDSSVYAYSGKAHALAGSGDFEAAKKIAEHAWGLIVATPTGEHALRPMVAHLLAQIADSKDDFPTARRWWTEALDYQTSPISRADYHSRMVRVAENDTAADEHRRAAAKELEAAAPIPDYQQPFADTIRALIEKKPAD